ncbi:MAG: hypothetical protein A2X45_05025 [Lentisphaerae bacterium GWF2_50_93]|nr:MAG: hypothetical protein A2X45_05025 [Lentisphaerae bacterium GWF2_50_93]
MILQIYFCHFTAWCDRLKKYSFVIFDKWHKIGIVFDIDDKYPLSWILSLPGMLNSIEQSIA